jgi:hypothetical protein
MITSTPPETQTNTAGPQMDAPHPTCRVPPRCENFLYAIKGPLARAAARPRPGASGVRPLRADPPRQPSRARVSRQVPSCHGLLVPVFAVLWAHAARSVAFGAISEHELNVPVAMAHFAGDACTVASLALWHEFVPLCVIMHRP